MGSETWPPTRKSLINKRQGEKYSFAAPTHSVERIMWRSRPENISRRKKLLEAHLLCFDSTIRKNLEQKRRGRKGILEAPGIPWHCALPHPSHGPVSPQDLVPHCLTWFLVVHNKYYLDKAEPIIISINLKAIRLHCNAVHFHRAIKFHWAN